MSYLNHRITKPLTLAYLILILVFGLLSCKREDSCMKGNGNRQTETRKLRNFTFLRIAGNMEVVFIPDSSGYSALVETDENLVPNLKTEVIDGRLSVFQDKCVASGAFAKVTVRAPTLEDITYDGSGIFVTNGVIKSPELNFIHNGSGAVVASVECQRQLRTSLTGSGSLGLTGSATLHNSTLIGSGNIRAYELQTSNTTIRIDGSGSAEVFVNSVLTADITGSGNVFYAGNPPVKNINLSGSGRAVPTN